MLALGVPAALWNVTAGQNGFLTATLIGGTLALLERHPALAGVCLGLLSYKPQFGVLFPLVLIADRRWLTIAVAAAVALGMAALSWLASAPRAGTLSCTGCRSRAASCSAKAHADWNRLQSLFGLMRAHGAGETAAWIVQAIGSLATAVGLIWLWRSRVAFELKAAGLAAGALVATPYLYMYDLVVLAVAVAFLLRLALERGFLISEIVGLGVAGALLLAFPYVETQVGLAAVLIVHGVGRAARACGNPHGHAA